MEIKTYYNSVMEPEKTTETKTMFITPEYLVATDLITHGMQVMTPINLKKVCFFSRTITNVNLEKVKQTEYPSITFFFEQFNTAWIYKNEEERDYEFRSLERSFIFNRR